MIDSIPPPCSNKLLLIERNKSNEKKNIDIKI